MHLRRQHKPSEPILGSSWTPITSGLRLWSWKNQEWCCLANQPYRRATSQTSYSDGCAAESARLYGIDFTLRGCLGFIKFSKWMARLNCQRENWRRVGYQIANCQNYPHLPVTDPIVRRASNYCDLIIVNPVSKPIKTHEESRRNAKLLEPAKQNEIKFIITSSSFENCATSECHLADCQCATSSLCISREFSEDEGYSLPLVSCKAKVRPTRCFHELC